MGRGLLSVQKHSRLERQIIVRQQDGFPSVQSLSHLGQGDASRRAAMGSRTPKCANIFTPRTLNRYPSARWFSKCAEFITPGTG